MERRERELDRLLGRCTAGVAVLLSQVQNEGTSKTLDVGTPGVNEMRGVTIRICDSDIVRNRVLFVDAESDDGVHILLNTPKIAFCDERKIEIIIITIYES